MKTWDVFVESFVGVDLPDDVDPATPAGEAVLLGKAREEYVRRILSGETEFTWKLYEEECDEPGIQHVPIQR
jgi:hypothetical protein